MDRSLWFRVYTQQLNALLRLDFSTAPYTVNLATEYKSLTHYTKVRSHTTKVLPLLVCMRFQDLFHSPHRGSFAFPSRYWFTIGQSGVFSLGGWSPIFRQGFTCLALLVIIMCALSCTGISPSTFALPRAFH